MEITLMSINRPMNKEDVAHIHTHTHTHTHTYTTMEYYSVIKNTILLFGTTWMILEVIMFVK